MHDSKGREIKVGDCVKFNRNGTDKFGLAAILHPDTTTCNLEVATLHDWEMPVNSGAFGPVKVTRKADGSTVALSVTLCMATSTECEIVAAVDGRDLTPPAPDIADGQTHAVQAPAVTAEPQNN